MKRIIIKTDDGSSSLFVPDLEENFHSTHGALTESMHVFINKGFRKIDENKMKILEIGFGTGLNCLLTYRESILKKKVVEYHTIELYPLTLEEFELLNYAEIIGSEYQSVYKKMHTCIWDDFVAIDDNFRLKKSLNNVILADYDTNFDLIYFDAFAPNKQPLLWTKDVFEKMSNAIKTGGILTTYCAKGEVRRILKSVGFAVERTDGPPGKREMVVATKL